MSQTIPDNLARFIEMRTPTGKCGEVIYWTATDKPDVGEYPCITRVAVLHECEKVVVIGSYTELEDQEMMCGNHTELTIDEFKQISNLFKDFI